MGCLRAVVAIRTSVETTSPVCRPFHIDSGKQRRLLRIIRCERNPQWSKLFVTTTVGTKIH